MVIRSHLVVLAVSIMSTGCMTWHANVDPLKSPTDLGRVSGSYYADSTVWVGDIDTDAAVDLSWLRYAGADVVIDNVKTKGVLDLRRLKYVGGNLYFNNVQAAEIRLDSLQGVFGVVVFDDVLAPNIAVPALRGLGVTTAWTLPPERPAGVPQRGRGQRLGATGSLFWRNVRSATSPADFERAAEKNGAAWSKPAFCDKKSFANWAVFYNPDLIHDRDFECEKPPLFVTFAVLENVGVKAGPGGLDAQMSAQNEQCRQVCEQQMSQCLASGRGEPTCRGGLGQCLGSCTSNVPTPEAYLEELQKAGYVKVAPDGTVLPADENKTPTPETTP